MRLKEFGEAEAAFRRVLVSDAANLAARLGLAKLYVASGQRKQAIEQCEYVGRLYQSTGELERAIEIFRRVLALDPSRALPHVSLADLLLGNGDGAEARKLLERAVELSPSDATVRSQALERILQLEPANRSLRLALADALVMQDRFKDAQSELWRVVQEPADAVSAEALERIVALEPRSVLALVRLAETALRAGHAAQSAALATRALGIAADDIDALRVHDAACCAAGNLELASKSYQKLQKLAPAEPAPRPLGASFESVRVEVENYLHYGLAGKAVQKLKKYLQDHPDDVNARLLLADSCLKDYDIDSASEELGLTLDLAIRLRDIELARRLLERCYALQPTSGSLRGRAARLAALRFPSVTPNAEIVRSPPST